MNDCSRGEIRDLLPDLVHDRLDTADRRMVQSHVATCDACASELRLIRTLRETLAVAPPVDISRIAAAVTRDVPRPPRSRTLVARQRMAAAIALLVAGAGAYAALGRSGGGREIASTTEHPVATEHPVVTEHPAVTMPSVRSLPPPAASGTGLTVGGGVSDLADVDVEALLRSVASVDGLIDTEPSDALGALEEGSS